MVTTRCMLGTIAIATSMLGSTVVTGQAYPTRPIRIVTSSLGGGVDFAARLIAQVLSSSIGQQVIVDNRGDHVTMEIVAKAQPDGYTLLITGAGFFIEPLFQKMSYDPVRDFAPITLAVSPPSVLIVGPSVPANSVKELIALAKSKPGQLNYASAGVGGASFLAAELFKSMAGVNIVHIPYKGSGPGLTDLMGGQIEVMFVAASVAPPLVKAGKVRALAVTTAQPTPLVPDLPTVAATLPGYEAVAIVGVYAPAKTPASLINRLNQEIVRGLNQPQIKERLLSIGTEVVGSTPEGLAATIKSETIKWAKVFKDLGIRGE